MTREITSIQNQEIKDVVHLRKRSARDEHHLVIVEGYTEVRRAVDAGVKVKDLYICKELFAPAPGEFDDIDITYVTKDVFKKMAFGERLKGILAICHQPHQILADLTLPDNPLVVVMEGVEKPGNLGAVLRTCDGAGVDLLIMCDGKTDVFNHNVVRSSIGTVFTVPTVAANCDETLAFLKKHMIKIYAATARATKEYTMMDYQNPSALFLGSENKGLSQFWFDHMDEQVTIPMKGAATCLNVAASAAILIYEAVRQRQGLS